MGRWDLWLDRFNLSEDLGRVRSVPFFQSSGKYEWKRHTEKIWAPRVLPADPRTIEWRLLEGNRELRRMASWHWKLCALRGGNVFDICEIEGVVESVRDGVSYFPLTETFGSGVVIWEEKVKKFCRIFVWVKDDWLAILVRQSDCAPYWSFPR